VTHVVATGLVTTPVPGTWQRLGLISSNGLLTGLSERQLIGQLEELGIPRHLYGVVRAVRSWQRAGIPTDVAFALWLLRDSIPGEGEGIPRRRGAQAEDTGATIRFLQLALAAGETTSSDPAIAMLATWLVGRQAEDGGVPANLAVPHGEVGTTARALRVLNGLHDQRLAESKQHMRRFLIDHSVAVGDGRAWSYGDEAVTPVTGATSLAGLALLEIDGDVQFSSEVARFLIVAQNSDGGWSEVPGHQSTIHNTFNVVRYLCAARKMGAIDDNADTVFNRAKVWFLRQLRQRTPRAVLDLAYALRLAVRLDLCENSATERIAERLCGRRNIFLASEADLYAETEIAAISILELSRHVDAGVKPPPCWDWRWALPAIPPPFLRRTAYLYELLYGLFPARPWIRVVDYLVNVAAVDRLAALLLGALAALGIVDDFVTESMHNLGDGIRGVVAVTFLAGMAAAWLAVKSCAYSSALRALHTGLWSLGVSALMTWLVYTPAPIFPSVIALVCLRWLVVDVVAHTVDASGLLDRMLPR
jgi:hypothetical protein